MTAATWATISGVVGAAVAVVALGAGGLRWLYRRGGLAAKLTSAVDAAVEAMERLGRRVEQNSDVTAQLSKELAAHQARTDAILSEHSRMLVQHDKRLSAVERSHP